LIKIKRRVISSGGDERLERLTIVPTSRQRTAQPTKRRVVVRPQQGVTSKGRTGLLSLIREKPIEQLVVNRPEAGNIDFDVLKEAKEGVWYRRVVDEEGVSLIRVKNDDDILNGNRQRTNEDQRRNGDQRRKNEDLILEDKEQREGFWYRRVEDEEGVRLIRVKNDDIILNGNKRRKENLTLEDKELSEGLWYRRVVDKEGVSLIRVKNDDVILNGNQRRNVDKQRTNEDLTLEDKEQSKGFWYRRVDDGNGGVSLVRVRNDDIIIKPLKSFRTQIKTRTRTSEAA